MTIELEGRWENSDTARQTLYYSEIRVLEGTRLLQTITPPHALPQPRAFDSDTAAQVTPPAANAPALGFSAESQLHALDLRDVDFDGFTDLAFPGTPPTTMSTSGTCGIRRPDSSGIPSPSKGI